jgi:hypothetical protein
MTVKTGGLYGNHSALNFALMINRLQRANTNYLMRFWEILIVVGIEKH